MRIDVLERAAGRRSLPRRDARRASACGAPRSRASKCYKYLKQVTNLSAPADYRASVRFRWLSSRSRTIRAQVLHTPLCEQTAPAEAPSGSGAPPAGG